MFQLYLLGLKTTVLQVNPLLVDYIISQYTILYSLNQKTEKVKGTPFLTY